MGTAYALRCEHGAEDDITGQIAQLLQDPQVSKVEALVFGIWSGFTESDFNSRILVNALINAKDQLTNLKAVFIGDIHYGECEISWIQQSNISPVLEAYPNLEVLQVRGTQGLGDECLSFSPLSHEHLEALIVESGGLYPETITEICALELPALEHLELWLGRDKYGGDSSVDDLMPILSGELFPNLIYLGLRNAVYTDDIAEAVVNSPILSQIKILDLSMGTMGEKGVEALISCDGINQLDVLNVSENFLDEEAIAQLKRLNIQVIADNQDEEDDDGYARYCSVAE
ncbi:MULTISPECIES: STM4015 family protein [unclassified Coleofasciculus]|uniref:STM4015 family protein n=1 Tax=unclassified Coleofasciculus TaxID=2692782 RepID=UPI002AD5AE48|nr:MULTISPECIES: STM4015 family protein [unclassified Coleofasciculus]